MCMYMNFFIETYFEKIFILTAILGDMGLRCWWLFPDLHIPKTTAFVPNKSQFVLLLRRCRFSDLQYREGGKQLRGPSSGKHVWNSLVHFFNLLDEKQTDSKYLG